MLKLLKTATGTRHAALEARLPLLQPALSRDAYRQFVERVFGFYQPLEVQLLTLPVAPCAGIDYALRHKTPRLLQDLEHLAVGPAAIAALPRCTALPSLDSPAQCWGALYVIEGATLGGQIILRHLQANLGLTAASGAAFFDGYGRETGAQWKAFCAAVPAAAELAPAEQDAMLLNANLTFDLFSEWLFPGSTGLATHPADRRAPEGLC